MKKRRIDFSLVYRDMWQSSGKYVPRCDQLIKIAPVIVDMGCFARVETNGGAFEQVNLLFGENPNTAVREWVKPFNQAGIQTHMLERALNGIRMFPVPADVRQLMYKVKKAQGVDIARSFCGLNDPRNLELSIKYAKEAGMISQAALSITHSPVHNVEYFMKVVDQAVEFGADEICLKDMAGIGRPVTLGKLVFAIKKKYPNIIVQYHGHSGPGFSVASMLTVAEAGADIMDVAMEPLSWGMVHPDVITIQKMLDDAGFEVPEINMKAYMEARALTQEFIDDFLGYFIDPKNRYVSSLMIESGLPGGMMGSLMADLKGIHQAINMGLEANGKKPISEDELLIKLFDEVTHIWPMMGYPPLVTPFSQYVKNTALINVLNMSQGKDRFTMIDNNTWDMLLGKAGQLPGKIDPIFEKMAKDQNRVFYHGVPQDAYPNALDKYRKEMLEKGWELGKDDEELFEFAMHETQYRDYKSGIAKKRFEEEIEKVKKPINTIIVEEPKAQTRNSSYSKKEADLNMAAIALVLHSLNIDFAEQNKSCCNQPDIWKTIGFWRPDMEVTILHNGVEFPVVIKKHKNNDYTLKVEQKPYECSLCFIDKTEADILIEKDCFNAKFTALPNGATKVSINGKSFDIKRLDILTESLDTETILTPVVKSETKTNVEKPVELPSTFLKQDIDVKSPMPGKVFEVVAKEGDMVKKGNVVIIIESMKMENSVLAPADGMVKKIYVKKNDSVTATTGLFLLGNKSNTEVKKEEPKLTIEKPIETAKVVKEVVEIKPIVEAPKPVQQTPIVGTNEVALKSPMPGKVFQILVKEGDAVKKGDTMVIIEFMKMENRVLATRDGIVLKINVTENSRIEPTTVLMILK
jgi:pyruvate carboxylase subunit B